jgi:hypothetical protein
VVLKAASTNAAEPPASFTARSHVHGSEHVSSRGMNNHGLSHSCHSQEVACNCPAIHQKAHAYRRSLHCPMLQASLCAPLSLQAAHWQY